MHNVKLTKFVSFMLAIMFAFGIFEPLGISVPAVTVYAADAGGGEKDDRDNEGQKNVSDDVDFFNNGNIDTSFAYQIRMAVNYANRMAAGGVTLGGDSNSYNGNFNMSNIGVFFGYTKGEINTDKVTSPEFSRGSRDSASSVTYSRDTFLSYTSQGEAVAAKDYYYYGLLLSELGFDSVGSSAPDTKRVTFGTIASYAYDAASMVNVMFEVMFNALDATNPFQFFEEADFDSGQGEIDKAVNNADSAMGGKKSAMTQLRTYISKIYKMFTEFAWAVAIPLALIFIIVAFFLTRRGRMSVGSNIKKFMIRVVFLVIGIPILGSAYTQVLSELKDSQAMSDDFLTQAVSYTFLDFGRWVEMRRLDPSPLSNGSLLPGPGGVSSGMASELAILAPSTAGKTSQDAVVTATSWFNIRKWCSALNETNGVFKFDSNRFLGVDTSGTGVLLKDFIYDTSEMDPHLSINSGGADGAGNANMDNRESVKTLLEKYTRGTKYSASMFEEGTIAFLNEHLKNYGDMLALSCNKYSFSQNATRKVENLQGKSKYYDKDNPEDAKEWSEVAKDRFTGYQGDFGTYNLWGNGTITMDAGGGASVSGDLAMHVVGASTGGSSVSGNVTAGLDPTKSMGFSTMAMFTYLTTEFTQIGAIAYDGAPTVYTQNAHHAVNLIGGSFMMQFAFFANMLAILVGYTALAFFFVFRTAFEVIFKGFQLIGHALFAALGFYKSIGTAICMTVNMIAELFVSVIFFSFMVDLMFIMTSIFNYFLIALGDKIGVPTNGVGSYLLSDAKAPYVAQMMVTASSLLATLVIIFFVSFAIRWRAAIMASLNSMIENIIGTLLGVQLGGASEGYMPGMAKAALNDTVNIARAGAAGAGAIALADGARDMVNDISSSAVETFGGDDENEADAGIPTGDTTAADAAANPSSGAGFDGGKGKAEGDAEVSASEVNDILENGIDGKPAGMTPESSGSSGSPEDVGYTKQAARDAEAKAAYEAASGSSGSSGNPETTGSAEQATSYEANNTANNDEIVLTRSDKAGAGNGAGAGAGNGAGNSAGNSNDSESEAENNDEGLQVSVMGGTGGGGHRHDNSSGETSTESTETATENVANETAAKTTTEDVVSETATVNETEAASASNEVTSSVTEDENGMTVWSQTNPETGTETTASFDMARGLVLKTTNEDGTVSDVAVGMNGMTTTTVDAEGNEQVVSVGKDGISTTYEGVDGTNETVDVDTATGTATVVRTDANGNTEEIVSDANGTTATKTETAADGSTRVTVTDENGEKTISEHNATTGYEATTNVAADGSAIKTESVNGVTTVTETDTNGDITSQAVTREDADGNEVTKSYSVNDDGTVESSVSKNGVTMKTVTDADGNRTEVQSLVRDDGTVVTTTTEYGTDSVADSTHTVVTSATGMETLQTADTMTGKDDIGEYTSNKITTAEGTTETKDYGNGHVITVETAANGNQSVIEKTSDGFNIKETDSATGNVTTTTVSSDGTGKTVVTASDGSVISQNEIKADDNGATSYTTATGGSILMGTVGEGKEKEQVVSQSYMTGGTMTTSTNAKTGDSVITATDGLGSQTVTNYDGKTGSTTMQFTHINGNSGQSVLESDGSYRQDVVTIGGGSQTTVRSGEGANAVETTVKTDIAGDTYSTVSKGGHMERVEVMSGGSASFTQEAGENGSIITRQVLESGAVVTKTQQSNGDYMQETVNPNGSKTYVESTDGKVTRKDISLTGIETTAMRTGSTTTESVQYAGVNMTHVVDNATGEKQQVFTTTSGQAFTIGSDSNGGTKTIFETGDGNYGSYKQNADGSTVNIVRNANGSGRVETTNANGAPEIIYTDASGNVVPEPQGADTFNNAYANALAGFASQNVSIPRHTAGVNVIYTNPVTETEQTGNLNLPEASDTANNNAAYNMPMNFDENGNVRTVKVHNKRTTMLERLYGGMISGDEPDSSDTSDVPTSKTTKRKPLDNAIFESMKLRRNNQSSGSFGDYDTRKGGSTTNAGNNANNAK